jgi:hypothetical protein
MNCGIHRPAIRIFGAFWHRFSRRIDVGVAGCRRFSHFEASLVSGGRIDTLREIPHTSALTFAAHGHRSH